MKNSNISEVEGKFISGAIFFIFLFNIYSVRAHGQNKTLDSVLLMLNAHIREDTVRLNLLNIAAQQQSLLLPEKGKQTAMAAVLLAEKLNDKTGLATAYDNLAACFNKDNKYDSSAFYFEKAISIYLDLGDEFKLGLDYSKVAGMYMMLTKTNKSFKYSEMALSIFEKLGTKKNIADVLNNMGGDYYKLSNIPKALECYFKALRIYESLGLQKEIASSFRDIGISYRLFQNETKALEFEKKSLAIYTRLNYKVGMARVLGSLGNLYDDMNDSAEAINAYQQALEINKQLRNKGEIALNLLNLGLFYYYQGDLYKALSYLDNSIDFLYDVGDENNLSTVFCYKGSIYRKVSDRFLINHGLNPNQRFKIAYRYYDSSLAIAEKYGSLVNQAYTLDEMAMGYEQQRNYKQALEIYKRALVIRDSINNNDKKNEITKLEMQNEFEKKEAQIKSENEKKQIIADAEIRNQRTIKNSVMGASGFLLLAGFAGFIFYKRNEDIKRQKISAEFNVKVADTEMKALRSQMNPHFIFNSLNSISDYISKKDTASANNYLVKFAKVMRMILENSEKKEVSLQEDLQALELYIQLESLRMNKKFTYEIKIDEKIDVENTLIPPLILQPFVENSIWHGLANKEGQGHILISIRKEGEMINCMVVDNGTGRQNMPKGVLQNPEKKSLGMKITKSRIEILNQTKKSNASLKISDLPQGVRAEVKLPLELNF